MDMEENFDDPGQNQDHFETTENNYGMPSGIPRDITGRFLEQRNTLLGGTPVTATHPPKGAVSLISDLFREQREAGQKNIDKLNTSIQSAELELLRHQTTLQTLELGIQAIEASKKLDEEDLSTEQKKALTREAETRALLIKVRDEKLEAARERVLALSKQVDEENLILDRLEEEEIQGVKWNKLGAQLVLGDTTTPKPEGNAPAKKPRLSIGDTPGTSHIQEAPGAMTFETTKDVDSYVRELYFNLKKPTLLETTILISILIDLYSGIFSHHCKVKNPFVRFRNIFETTFFDDMSKEARASADEALFKGFFPTNMKHH